ERGRRGDAWREKTRFCVQSIAKQTTRYKMNTSHYIDEIAERLFQANHPEGFPALLVALLRELATGSAVSNEVLAKRLGWPAETVVAVLDQTPGIEYDDRGRLIGYGLTLRETPHSFEVDGRRLYTWCALDTLMIPAVIGRTAHIRSRCPQTGEPVTLTVAPNEMVVLEPAGVTVSLLPPGAMNDIRSSFCCHVHFFASRRAGEDWLLQNPGAEIVSVEDAFRLGQGIAHQLAKDAEVPPS
ncbi:MAG: organomercurial lyase MerB, partial [Noviherbaspirillum sp.]